MLKQKLFSIVLPLSAAILTLSVMVGFTNQPGNVQNASEARDAALSYLENRYTDNVPGTGLIWQEYNTTPEGLIGSETIEFISDLWMIQVSYPIVLAENMVFDVVLLNMESGWYWEGNVDTEGTVTEVRALEQVTKEGSEQIALDFVRSSPTYVFDGIEDTLELVDSIEVSIPLTWMFVIEFESAHAGYGDRTGNMLAEVITPHELSIAVEQGEIAYASIDNVWDMINQEEFSDPIDPDNVILREESDITGIITEIDPVCSETIDGRILVELEQPNNTSDKFWVTIEKNTPIYEYNGQDHYTVAFGALQNGQTVEVWFKGPVMESYPAQVKAEEVLVRSLIDYDSLVDSLRSAGATVEHETLPQVIVQDFFSVTGQVFKVNGEEVQVFEYSVQAAAEEEAVLVSTDGSYIGTSMPFWVAPPHFYQAGRIIALYVGENLAVTEALETVLGTQFAGQQIQTSLPIQDETAIYAAVIRQLATEDDTFGGNLNPDTLYVIKSTDDSAGNTVEGQPSNTHMITETMQDEISRMISDLNIDIVWVNRFGDAEFEQSNLEVKRGRAIITLGNIYLKKDGSVQVAGSIYIANLAAGGTTYVLEDVDGSWEITGRVGPTWMS
ncbi:MAG: DUF3221 domain-containing protein [Dehalococcoidales bacterium]|nr:MAG: DUF3221 domain-containing protein [Dehalococcoidales bacterium]